MDDHLVKGASCQTWAQTVGSEWPGKLAALTPTAWVATECMTWRWHPASWQYWQRRTRWKTWKMYLQVCGQFTILFSSFTPTFYLLSWAHHLLCAQNIVMHNHNFCVHISELGKAQFVCHILFTTSDLSSSTVSRFSWNALDCSCCCLSCTADTDVCQHERSSVRFGLPKNKDTKCVKQFVWDVYGLWLDQTQKTYKVLTSY